MKKRTLALLMAGLPQIVRTVQKRPLVGKC